MPRPTHPVIRLLDGTKAYLQAIIDNHSRRILAWRLGPKLEPAATATLLVKAYESRNSTSTEPQSVMVDGATVVQADVIASNGVIHVIDEVILPN